MALRRRGYLTRLTEEEESGLVARVAAALHRRAALTPTYIFVPTYNCNLRCSYCFQDHMRTDPAFAPRLGLMSPEVIGRIFLAIDAVEALHGPDPATRSRSFGFFGGEPLLRASVPAVARIVELARARFPDSNFWAVTNGTELDAYGALLGPAGISYLQITLDGPPPLHDRIRVHPDGTGSFEQIGGNIDRALEAGARVAVRLNLDRANIGGLRSLVSIFASRGWSGHPRFSVYAAPVRAENAKTDRRSVFSQWELGRTLEAMRAADPALRAVSAPDDGQRARARQIFDRGNDGEPAPLRESFCSAHTGMYIFDAFADIYACWERLGDPPTRIGRVDGAGALEMQPSQLALWRTRTVASNRTCLRCRYALHCGGGCAVLAQASTGEYHRNFCDGFANRFRAAVAEAYIDHAVGAALGPDGDRPCDQ